MKKDISLIKICVLGNGNCFFGTARFQRTSGERNTIKVAIHLTHDCNLRCTYCYVGEKYGVAMSKDILEKTIQFAFYNSAKNVDLTFFGGEPLLEKDLLFYGVEFAQTFKEREKIKLPVRFFVTTNGLLLDEEFLIQARENDVHITLSLDGSQEGHDLTRKQSDGSGSFAKIAENFPGILHHQPAMEILMTPTPGNVRYLAKGVKDLFECGFKIFHLGPNYEEEWPPEKLKTLSRELDALGNFYTECFRTGKYIFISTIDSKISTHTSIKGTLCSCCDKQDGEIAVAPSGNIFPCLRFVKTDKDHSLLLGNVTTGLDKKLRARLLAKAGKEWPECRSCGYLGRCFHYCSAVNFKVSGKFNQPPPILCHLEKMGIDVADKIAEVLYNERNPQFMKRFYVTSQ